MPRVPLRIAIEGVKSLGASSARMRVRYEWPSPPGVHLVEIENTEVNIHDFMAYRYKDGQPLAKAEFGKAVIDTWVAANGAFDLAKFLADKARE